MVQPKKGACVSQFRSGESKNSVYSIFQRLKKKSNIMVIYSRSQKYLFHFQKNGEKSILWMKEGRKIRLVIFGKFLHGVILHRLDYWIIYNPDSILRLLNSFSQNNKLRRTDNARITKSDICASEMPITTTQIQVKFSRIFDMFLITFNDHHVYINYISIYWYIIINWI